MLKLGLDQTWQFLIVMNIFLLVLGMLMDGFSAILVAVPLILPFAARFKLGPFHLAMIFLLNLEIAYCCPPLGLNLFISSFRFNRPVVSLYRVVLPFAGILAVALVLVSYVPRISEVLILGDIAAARADAAKVHLPPREAWIMECVQEDRTNPLPCTEEEKKAYPGGHAPEAPTPAASKPSAAEADAGTPSEDDEILKQDAGRGRRREQSGRRRRRRERGQSAREDARCREGRGRRRGRREGSPAAARYGGRDPEADDDGREEGRGVITSGVTLATTHTKAAARRDARVCMASSHRALSRARSLGGILASSRHALSSWNRRPVWA